jgi:LysR family transcriptional regulator, glycine cleavage system transcriptional activator
MPRQRDLPLSLDLLRGFEAAARLLSFTSAASELFITQSAVSRQVQQLEEQLGVKLFERRTRALVLTEAGALYFREVSKALHLLREATATVRARTTPVVRVTTTVTFAALWLVPRLAAFQAQHEDISVHVVADNTVRDLERHSLDVAIRYCPPDVVGADAVRLFGESVTPVCSPAFLKKHRVRRPEDLMALPLIELEDHASNTIWLSWKVWCEAMKLEQPRDRRGLVFSHYDQVIQAAVAGQGVALGRFPLVRQMLDDGRLVVPLKSKQYSTPQQRAYWLMVTPTSAARHEVTTFTRWLRAQVAVGDSGDSDS